MTKTAYHHYRTACCTCIAVLCLFLMLPPAGFSTVLYRSYVVKYDRGWDILCDAYIVQKDDWVYKIFRQKGEISSEDFREFLSIFNRLNTHIRNIDRIRPNQHILIPLKKLEPDTLPGQSSGIVTIPFVSISKISEFLELFSKPYKVKKGDSVSELIANRFGNFGTRSYREGFNLFKTLNPDILNLDLIYVGQNIVLPDPAMRNEPWYHSLFDTSGNIRSDTATGTPVPTKPVEATRAKQVEKEPTPLSKAASILEAKLLNKGTYFFPKTADENFELDLARFPVIEMENGMRIVFEGSGDELDVDIDVLKNRWKDVEVVTVIEETSLEQILGSVLNSQDKQVEQTGLSFSDHGLDITVRAQWITAKPVDGEGKVRHICITMVEDSRQRTPEAIARYLDWHGIIIKDVLKENPAAENKPPKVTPAFVLPDVISLAPADRKTFVGDLIKALGYHYTENVSVTFPYAGMQINAVSNLVSTENGHNFLLDFGELYGDAVQEIKKTGLGIVQIVREDSLDDIIKKIFAALDVTYAVDPLFIAAARPAEFNTVLKIPGYLVYSPDSREVLLSAIPLHNRVLQFLNKRDVKVILTGLMTDF